MKNNRKVKTFKTITMKSNLVIVFTLFFRLHYSLRIDINNFDSKLTEKILFQKLLYYRDTIQTFASGVKISEYSKNFPDCKENLSRSH